MNLTEDAHPFSAIPVPVTYVLRVLEVVVAGVHGTEEHQHLARVPAGHEGALHALKTHLPSVAASQPALDLPPPVGSVVIATPLRLANPALLPAVSHVKYSIACIV